MAATVPLVALKKHSYGKGSLTPGQPFEAAERDATILVQLGIAKRADVGAHPEQPIAPPASPRPRPEPPIVEPPEPTPLPLSVAPTEPTADEPREAKPMTVRSTRGTYKRRDLTAEDQ